MTIRITIEIPSRQDADDPCVHIMRVLGLMMVMMQEEQSFDMPLEGIIGNHGDDSTIASFKIWREQ